jgi:predicted Rossmann fold flavoprotein
LFPTEVPITSKEPYISNRSLQGLALRDVGLSVLNKKGKPLVTHRMDMLFTHFGLSGPAALRCSQYVVKELKKNGSPVYMSIDAFPDGNEHEAGVAIRKMIKEEPKKAVKNSLKKLVPERYLHFLLEQTGIDLESPGNSLSDLSIRELASSLKSFKIAVSGTLPIEKAFVTGGGVSVKEIEPKTMASKKKDGLFFCGEIIDIHGYTGGYNITAALITGHIAGTNAAAVR